MQSAAIALVSVMMAAIASVVPAPGQVADPQPLVLDARSASHALDAIPAVFAVARNLEDVEIDVGVNGMASGFSELADQTAAQEQLVAALGAYNFESYGSWATTTQTIFSTYSYIQSQGAGAPAVEAALKRVMNDPDLPQRQKEVIEAQMKDVDTPAVKLDTPAPSQMNLEIVIALMPQIASTVEMIRAMQ